MTFPDDFEPDAPRTNSDQLFGLPLKSEACAVQVLPSAEASTHLFDDIQRASLQLELHDFDYGDIWKEGIGRLPPVSDCYQRAKALLASDRIVGLLGGQRGHVLGLIRAASAQHPGVGVLHLDARLELGAASLLGRVLQIESIGRVVGVGYREARRQDVDGSRHSPRHHAFFEHDLARQLAEGASWSRLCEAMVGLLPAVVVVSLNVSGLNPAVFPHTRRLVPGGLSWREITGLLKLLSERRRVIGFELCEVVTVPGGGDANVGARLLYKLAGCALHSRLR